MLALALMTDVAVLLHRGTDLLLADQHQATVALGPSQAVAHNKRALRSSFEDEDGDDNNHNNTAAGSASKRLCRRRVLRPGLPTATSLASFKLPDKHSPPLRGDDEDGHYVYELGDNISSRYKILSKMGEGTFGRVLECWDRKRKDYVAIKIVRNIDKYRHAAMIELEVLNTLEKNDPQGRRHCVALREWFEYRGHVCMVFEKLGLSLFDFLKRNTYKPFTVDLVQDFSRQLLDAVAYMHELDLVHTDLKPENILLVSQEYTRSASVGSSQQHRVPLSSSIKVIDFGSATFENQYHSTVVSTRHYRAPEVILGLGWSYPCDVWSIGCIIIELITGEALFHTHENLEHLAMMEAVLGTLPQAMVLGASKVASKYFARGRLHWPEGAPSRKAVKMVKRLTNIRMLILQQGHVSAHPYVNELADLLMRMLRYEPEQRITPADALNHPFFRLQLSTASSGRPQSAQQLSQSQSQGPLPAAAGQALSLSLLPDILSAQHGGSTAAHMQQLGGADVSVAGQYHPVHPHAGPLAPGHGSSSSGALATRGPVAALRYGSARASQVTPGSAPGTSRPTPAERCEESDEST